VNTDVLSVSQTWLIDHAVTLLVAIIILAVGWYLAGFLSHQVYKILPRTRRVDSTITPLASTLVRYGVLLLTFIIVLSQFGVQTASILAVLGAAGLAIALALQGTLSNLAAGIMMIWLRPFNVGESINAGEASGTVVEIGLFGTRIITYDGVHVFAPNSSLWSAIVTNWSRQPRRMVEIKLPLSYRAEFATIKAELLEIARDPRILHEPAAPFVFIDSFGELGITVGLRVWVKSADWWNTKCDLLAAIKQRFDAQGIAFAYRRNDVLINYDPDAVGTAPLMAQPAYPVEAEKETEPRRARGR
jgi:small conductance mechanosensitive channel